MIDMVASLCFTEPVVNQRPRNQAVAAAVPTELRQLDSADGTVVVASGPSITGGSISAMARPRLSGSGFLPRGYRSPAASGGFSGRAGGARRLGYEPLENRLVLSTTQVGLGDAAIVPPDQTSVTALVGAHGDSLVETDKTVMLALDQITQGSFLVAIDSEQQVGTQSPGFVVASSGGSGTSSSTISAPSFCRPASAASSASIC
jgi:hypothetical protein